MIYNDINSDPVYENQIYHEKKYKKYLTKNKLLLEQIYKQSYSHEQDVRFVAIELISELPCKDYDALRAIMDTYGTANIISSLHRITKPQIDRSLKQKHKNLKTVAIKSRDQFKGEMETLLNVIRGENNLLQFDIFHVVTHINYDRNANTYKKCLFVLQLLPPDETTISSCVNYGQHRDISQFWSMGDYNKENTLNFKWLSDNNAWKWNAEKKVWTTNDVRPWYFENDPSPEYVKTTEQWDNSLKEIKEEEENMKRYLNRIEEIRQRELNKKSTGKTIIENFFNIFTKNSSKSTNKKKVYVLNDNNDADRKSDRTAASTDIVSY
jgi:hypothetical protein